MATCNTCGHPSKNGICKPKAFRIPKHLTDAEASRVILPKLKTQYVTKGGAPTERVRFALRNEDGTPIVASRGDGRITQAPKGGWTLKRAEYRYLEAMGIDKADADPRAIDWGHHAEWLRHDPQAGRCNVCGRGTSDGAVCDSCAEWSEAIADEWSRTRDEAITAAHMAAELAAA